MSWAGKGSQLWIPLGVPCSAEVITISEFPLIALQHSGMFTMCFLHPPPPPPNSTDTHPSSLFPSQACPTPKVGIRGSNFPGNCWKWETNGAGYPFYLCFQSLNLYPIQMLVNEVFYFNLWIFTTLQCYMNKWTHQFLVVVWELTIFQKQIHISPSFYEIRPTPKNSNPDPRRGRGGENTKCFPPSHAIN